MTVEDSGRQASLFPEVGHPVVYEQPLNERIRNCLRLEHMFHGIESGILGGSTWDARSVLTRMLEVSDFLTRTDIKGELIKELEREIATLNSLRDNPGVSPEALDKTVGTIGSVLATLKSSDCQPGASLRNDELASLVRQRITIPGGTCSFDVPALHYWLNADPALRSGQIYDWMRDLEIIETATRTILRLIRDSSHPRQVLAERGFYQQQVDATLPCQIVRVVMKPEERVFPEISGGKHRFTIRFYAQPETANRPVQHQEDVDFELHCCGI